LQLQGSTFITLDLFFILSIPSFFSQKKRSKILVALMAKLRMLASLVPLNRRAILLLFTL